MEHRMTSWTLNIVLAAMAASAVVLPAPNEIRKALEYGRETSPIVITDTSSEEIIQIETVAAINPAEVRITYAPTVGCIQQLNGSAMEKITGCLPQLLDQVQSFDRSATTRASMGSRVYPNPTIEQARSALVGLCRAKWSAEGSLQPSPDLDGCRSIMQGLAY